MPGDSDHLISALHEFFPERAQGLAGLLERENRRSHKLEEWRERQLCNFIQMLILSATDLERALVEKRVMTLAWTTRNLLELSIWIDYCNLSDAHAKRFRDDAAKDLYGFTCAVQSLEVHDKGREDPQLDRAQQNLVGFARSWGINALEDDFTRVSVAAAELGREKTFLSLNKLLSKLAHPTAWAVNSVESIRADEGFRGMFFGDGVEMATGSLTSIRTFVIAHLPSQMR
jgi:hypothetical protein